MYELNALLLHRGSSAHQGHYVAQVRDAASGAWLLLDDDYATTEKLDAAGLPLLGGDPSKALKGKPPKTKAAGSKKGSKDSAKGAMSSAAHSPADSSETVASAVHLQGQAPSQGKHARAGTDMGPITGTITIAASPQGASQSSSSATAARRYNSSQVYMLAYRRPRLLQEQVTRTCKPPDAAAAAVEEDNAAFRAELALQQAARDAYRTKILEQCDRIAGLCKSLYDGAF